MDDQKYIYSTGAGASRVPWNHRAVKFSVKKNAGKKGVALNVPPGISEVIPLDKFYRIRVLAGGIIQLQPLDFDQVEIRTKLYKP